MASEGVFASKAWAIDSVVAGRYDEVMVTDLKNANLPNENNCASLV